MSGWIAGLVLAGAGAVFLLLVPLSLHRGILLLRSRRDPPLLPPRWAGPLPSVLVQLPMYNEPEVAARAIDAAASLDHPAELLEIQILDDSTDDTPERVRERVDFWRARGVRIIHRRRIHRRGFKAGALAEGLRESTAPFVLILDADFVSPPSLIRDLLPPFSDPGIGMVQGRWDHLNREESVLTRAQGALLDAHFAIEHRGRWAAGLFFNFNGSGGMWRRSCIMDAGGWHEDTLTEDLDLSYRAQLRGWRFAYLDTVGVPGELPPRLGSLEIQQGRWVQGGVQTARKLLPRILRERGLPLRIRGEAALHLLGHGAHPLTVLAGMLVPQALLARGVAGLPSPGGWDAVLALLLFLPLLALPATALRSRGQPWRRVLTDAPAALVVGISLTIPLALAFFRGWRSGPAVFHRTPKEGGGRLPGVRKGIPVREAIVRVLSISVLLPGIPLAVEAGAWGTLAVLFLLLGSWGWGLVGRLREAFGGSRGDPGAVPGAAHPVP